MNEKEYDAIMHEAEEAYKHQTKLNNPHAFHRAFELAQRKVEAWIPEIFDTLEICCGAISDAVCGRLEKETAEAVINLVKEQFGKNGHEFNMQFPDEINLDGWIPVEELFFLLVKAVELIRGWHGEAAWEIYYTQSPEMKKIREALDAYLNAPPKEQEGE